MSLPVFWTPEAEDTFGSIIDFIRNNWGEKHAVNFIKRSEKVINTISTQPYMFKGSYSQNIRQGFVTKQRSLFYQINDNYIVILFFWDNRQEPII
ncbi:MAG TPA: hypothetical protein DIT07_00310 [Sphingobacteriaceae bacterium]|nr:hypothetical protein [Sphingobacteriaceae bacterium]